MWHVSSGRDATSALPHTAAIPIIFGFPHIYTRMVVNYTPTNTRKFMIANEISF